MATLETPVPAPATAPAPSSRPRRLARPSRTALGAALAALTLLVTASVSGHLDAAPARPVADPCGSPSAVTAALNPAIPATAVSEPAGDDPYEVRGDRRPDSPAVPAAFRAFQACRQRPPG